MELEFFLSQCDPPQLVIVDLPGPSTTVWAVREWVSYRVWPEDVVALIATGRVQKFEHSTSQALRMQRMLSCEHRFVLGSSMQFEHRKVQCLHEHMATGPAGCVWFLPETFDAVASTVGRDAGLAIARSAHLVLPGYADGQPVPERLRDYARHSAVWLRGGQPVAVLGACVPPREYAHDFNAEGLCVPC
jgi:hypothetical protein